MKFLFRGPVAATAAVLLLSVSNQAQAESAKPELIQPGISLSGNYLSARIADTDLDSANATTFYRSAMALDPEDVVLKQRAFQAFMANGDFDDAVDLAQILGKVDQLPELASIVIAANHVRSKAWSAAGNTLDVNWRSAVNRLVAGILRGWALAGDGKTEEALALVDELKGPAWFDLFVQYHGGLIALNGGNSDDGIRRLQIAFNNKDGGRGANNTYLRVVQSLTKAFQDAGRTDQAKELANIALNLQPQNPVIRRLHKDTMAGKAPEARVNSPQLGAAEIFFNIGTAINRDGGAEFAKVYLHLANTLAPGDDSILIQLAELYDQQRKIVRANTLFEQVSEKSSLHRIARMEVAINLDELGEKDKAKEIFQALLESDPDDIGAYLTYGSVLARHENYLGVIPVLQQMIDRVEKPERRHWSLFYRQGIAYERTKQWPKAEAAFKKALELFPNQPSVLNYLGYSWVDMGINLNEGLDLIRKAVDLRPNDGYMVDSLGWAYYRLGRFEDAVVDLERAVSLRPGDPTINDHLGDAYWRAGRKLEATFQWRHALALDPPTEKEARAIEDKLENGLPDKPSTIAKPEEKKPNNG